MSQKDDAITSFLRSGQPLFHIDSTAHPASNHRLLSQIGYPRRLIQDPWKVPTSSPMPMMLRSSSRQPRASYLSTMSLAQPWAKHSKHGKLGSRAHSRSPQDNRFHHKLASGFRLWVL